MRTEHSHQSTHTFEPFPKTNGTTSVNSMLVREFHIRDLENLEKSSMYALSIKQPWVHAILHLGKDIENRTWQRAYRGVIALHASAKPSVDAEYPGRLRVPDLTLLDYSAICGVAELADIVTFSRSRWFYSPSDGETNYGWILRNVRLLREPIPCNGRLGLWEVPSNIGRKIRQQIPGV